MKIISWNVNSIRTRLERVVGLLRRHEPDLLCIQETKVTDDAFPAEALSELGYTVEAFGQRGGYNGVALIAREPLQQVERSFDGNPAPDEARVVSGRIAGVTVVNAYVINGQSIESEKYQLKLDWLDALTRWLRRFHDPARPLVLLGDFNIAPDDRDIYNPEAWRGKVLCSDAERRRLQALLDWGLRDLLREHKEEGGIYSWWDYRYGAFNQDRGLRIDLILATAALRSRGVEIDREERDPGAGPGKPSDHAPVIAELALGGES